ncbi:ATP-dependent endonuclease [Bacillus cereus]|uniref:ATP-dependent nuclease n=1 Tax=Bacillus wiedmannii TaxID=1890302 RepID=UPI000BF9C8A6|nr:AAA family ATPase [Bacillus wiedmannii]PFI36193.1 ATP-dependent endonuclease [Bacillus cereus]PFX60235.1 ATP-dependent endonuclease [Bacillus wiedmannii]PGL39041.1 ATP-dependent endonuclease [Bacillus cereus]PGP00892.1 ATP-dependent endonuclease [Bacillus cereus]
MYLHSLKLWNWRKFGEKENNQPGLEVEFNKGLNVLVGENDSGKTAIIDAIKTILGTNSNDTNWITEEDFYSGSNNLKIECKFKGLSKKEEAYFFDWLSFVNGETELRIVMEIEYYTDLNGHKKIKKSTKAGDVNLENVMDDEVKQLLAVTYLKPLRDADVELNSGKKSRIAQIIKSLKEFSSSEEVEHKKIIDEFQNAFDNLKTVLEEPVLKKVKSTVDEFFNERNKRTPEIRSNNMTFVEILRKLELSIGEVGTGLGSSNLLFIAAELLLLSEGEIGPKLALIEEVEAHIHPQAQLRLIKYFEKKSNENEMQYIFSSHSTTLASSIPLENLIFIYNSNAYPMRKGATLLEDDDYSFLERFLDATKANMFFAQGVIFVEGDAENLLIPTIAELIGRPLHKHGVSIVNVGALAFKRYSSIFLRKEEQKPLNFPVSIITDLDLKPIKYYDSPSYFLINSTQNKEIIELYDLKDVNDDLNGSYVDISSFKEKLKKVYGITQLKEEVLEILQPLSELEFEAHQANRLTKLEENFFHGVEETRIFVSAPWTLEYAIAKSSFSKDFQRIVVESKYTDEGYKSRQLESWREITDDEELAVDVYKFILKKQVSKSIMAQNFAEYLLQNKKEAIDKISQDNELDYVVKAILHVTGGE